MPELWTLGGGLNICGSMDIFGSTSAKKMPLHFFHGAVSIDYATAVRADISRQDYSVCPRHWYVDAKFKCSDCGAEFLFSAKEQQFWYEERRFYVDSYPKRCPDCRKKERVRKASVLAPIMAKRQKWKVGDLFKIPLADGSASLGHIVAQEREMLNSVTCAFYDTKVPETCPPQAPPLLSDEALIACLFTTHDLLDSGLWNVIGHSSPQVSREQLPYEDCRRSGWVGAKMRGSGIVRKFLDAYYRLAPWDDWADPKYLDAFLIDPSKRPKDLIYVKTTDA